MSTRDNPVWRRNRENVKETAFTKENESMVLYIYMHGCTIWEARVSPPSNPLVRRKPPWPLAFKKNDWFGKSISVVVLGKARVVVVAKRLVVMERKAITLKDRTNETSKQDYQSQRGKRETHFFRLPQVKQPQPTTNLQPAAEGRIPPFVIYIVKAASASSLLSYKLSLHFFLKQVTT